MSRAHDPMHERIEELVIDQVLHGAEPAAELELRQLNAREARELSEEFEGLAATAHLAFAAERPKALPTEVRERLLACIPNRTALRRQPPPWTAQAEGRLRVLRGGRDEEAAPTRVGGFVATLGWAVAAAAVLALAFNASLFGPSRGGQTSSLAVQREELLRTASDATVVPWSGSAELALAGMRGDVVWSQARQQGFLRFSGVPANTPTEQQYQLWIVDPTRDAKHPIDGGVFDVPAGESEVVIPIDPKLRVEGATVFAITLEKPGGVVVSEGPLLAVAKL